MQTLELKHLGLYQLTKEQSLNINGGAELSFPKWLKRLTPYGLACYVVENWADIKKGLNDGWKFDK